MKALVSAISPIQGLILAVTIVGCATAACLTGHISGQDLLGVFGGVTVIGGGVGVAHVVGTQVNTAAVSAVPAPTPGSPPAA